MDFTAVFAKTDNSTAVQHPGGAVFNILPYMSQDIQVTATRNLKLTDIERYEAYLEATTKAEKTGETVKMSDYFSTLDEVQSIMRGYLACHVTGWQNLEMAGKPLEFSYATTLQLIETAQPFADWVLAEAKKLAEVTNNVAEVAEDIKKKSADTTQ